MMLNIRLFKALNGDSIVISYGKRKTYHILIDGGCGKLCYRQLCNFIEELRKGNGKIDLLILTHIDSDHIDGILRLFSKSNFDFSLIKEIWFNFGKGLQEALKIEGVNRDIYLYDNDAKISWQQGDSLEGKIQSTNMYRKSFIKAIDCFLLGGAEITILSPSVETLYEFAKKETDDSKLSAKIACMSDYNKEISDLNEIEFEGAVSLTNKSSIAFLFEFEGKKLLLLGDAEAATIEKSLLRLGYSRENRLKVDYCKIAHHASKHNTSKELIEMIDCRDYIISTQRTTQGRPSKECLSRIICNVASPVNFYCNYDINADKIFTEAEFLRYKMKFITLDEKGIDIEGT